MSQWEFSISPARLAVLAGCLAGAGLIVAAAGFTAGLIFAPRYSPVLAEAVKQEEAKQAAIKVAGEKKFMAVKEAVKVPAAIMPVPAAPPPAEAKPEAAKAQDAKPPEAKPQDAKAEDAKAQTANAETATVKPPAPDAKSDAKPEPKPAPKPPISLQVQVASFASQANADSTVDRLKRSGYPAYAVSRTDPSSKEWHVVQVGPYYAYDVAAKTVLELSNAYRVSPVIISTRTAE